MKKIFKGNTNEGICLHTGREGKDWIVGPYKLPAFQYMGSGQIHVLVDGANKGVRWRKGRVVLNTARCDCNDPKKATGPQVSEGQSQGKTVG